VQINFFNLLLHLVAVALNSKYLEELFRRG